MPYTKSQPPAAIKSLPSHAQEIWISAFNASYKEHGDGKAHAIAWSAVKRQYRKRGGRWVKRMPKGKQMAAQNTPVQFQARALTLADAPQGDYGSHTDAGYADPGYQEDKKPRYPLKKDGKLNEERIRAAWNYISKPDNAKLYSDADLKKVKDNIIAAWKSEINKDGPPAAQTAQPLRGEMIALADSALQDNVVTIQVLRAGEFEDMHGTAVTVKSRELDAYIANSNAELKARELPVDLGHPTDPGAPAAAWYREFFKQTIDGVEWICARVELTGVGVKSLADKLYKYFSASLDLNAQKVIGGGFVNRPAVSGQQPVGSLSEYLIPRVVKNEGGKPMVKQNWLASLRTRFNALFAQAELQMSDEQLHAALMDALCGDYADPMAMPNAGTEPMPYPFATYDDHVIVVKGNDLLWIDFTIDADGDIVLGDPIPVEITKAATDAGGGGNTDGAGNTAPMSQSGGETNMEGKQGQQGKSEIELAEERGRAEAQAQLAALQAQLAEAQKKGYETAMAEAKRKHEIAEFAAAVTTGKIALPQTQAEITELLEALPDDARVKVQAVLERIVKGGTVDLSERGSSAEGKAAKKLNDAQTLALARHLKSGGKVEKFFAANALGKPEEYDLSAVGA